VCPRPRTAPGLHRVRRLENALSASPAVASADASPGRTFSCRPSARSLACWPCTSTRLSTVGRLVGRWGVRTVMLSRVRGCRASVVASREMVSGSRDPPAKRPARDCGRALTTARGPSFLILTRQSRGGADSMTETPCCEICSRRRSVLWLALRQGVRASSR
jgi:hypothetical protein